MLEGKGSLIAPQSYISYDSETRKAGAMYATGQIEHHITQNITRAVPLTIFPADAEALLKRNHNNRSISRAALRQYKRDMERGWKLTGETIIVSKTGNLLNGQHRLQACIESGRPFLTLVAFGIDDDAFAFMDVGRKRTAGDIFTINGVSNANVVAAAARWVWQYEHTDMQSPGGGLGPTADRLYDYFVDNHPTLVESAHVATSFSHLASPSLMVALHYLCFKHDAALADAFFSSLATGADLKGNSPILKLRQRLINSRIAGKDLSPIFVAAFTVMTWNTVRKGRKLGRLRWRGDGAPEQEFPKIV